MGLRRQLGTALALVLLLAARPARGDDAPSPDGEGPKDKLAWLLSDEDLPDPPIVRAQAGIILWPYLRTSLTIGRKHDLPGQQVEAAEDSGGLPARWFSPTFEATVGTSIRGGVAFLDLDRQGDFTRTDVTWDVGGGRILAKPGDYVQVGFHYSQFDAYGQWDVFRSLRLKIGLVGGARVLRLSTRIAGVRLGEDFGYSSIALNDWIVSPLVGGQVELEPVSSFTVFSSIRFIDWAWRELGLREERAFEVKLGCTFTFIEDMLSAAVDFRFLSVLVNPSDLNGGKNLARYELDAGGVGLTVMFRY